MIDYLVHIGILICLNVSAGQILSLIVNQGGRIVLATAGILSLGAYTFAISSTELGLNSLLSLMVVILVGILFGQLISIFLNRTKDDNFMLGTLALQFILIASATNFTKITNGPFGIGSIPEIVHVGLDNSSQYSWFIAFLAASALCWLILNRVQKSNYISQVQATEADEIYVLATGKNSSQLKTSLFTFITVLLCLYGALYGSYLGYISPNTFSLYDSLLVLCIVYVAGLGANNLTRIALAAIFLTITPELIRLISIDPGLNANLRQIFFGIVLLTSAVWCGMAKVRKVNI